MASQPDVIKAYVAKLNAEFFPGMNPNPNVMTTTPDNISMRIYRGWPIENRLDGEVVKGQGVHISVYPVPYNTQDTTRFVQKWSAATAVPITINAVVSNGQVTFVGTGTAGQVVGIGLDNTGYAMRLTGGESSAAIASYFASIMPGSSTMGPILTPPQGQDLTAQVVSDTTMLKEIRTQKDRFTIGIWAPTPQLRDDLSTRADMALTNVYLPLPYGTSTNLMKSLGSSSMNMNQKAGIFRRDLEYQVEYSTYEVKVYPSILFVGINTSNGTFGRFSPAGPTTFIW